MANYLLACHGSGAIAQDEAARNQIIAQWGKWLQDLSPALVDGGNPVMRAKTLSRKGGVSEAGGQNPVSGYSLIKADSLDAAVKLARGCPVLQSCGSIEVAETFNAMQAVDGPSPAA